VAPCRYFVNRRFGERIAFIFRAFNEDPLARIQREQVAVATYQKTAFFIVTAEKTWNIIKII
jgi:hypothetical protein